MILHPHHRFKSRKSRNASFGGAFFLIAIGLMFLAANMIPGLSFERVFRHSWPIMLIVMGAITFVKAVVLRGGGGIVGGFIMMAVGVLFTLDAWAGLSFGRTWPVLAVVAGVSILLRKMFSIWLPRRMS